MYKKSDLFYTVLHLPVDIIAIVLAFITSYWLRGNGLEIYRLPFNEYLTLVYRAVPLWILIFVLQGLYTKRYLFGTLQNFLHMVITVLASWASFVVFLVFLKNEQTLVFPRLMLIYILIFSVIYVFTGRLLLRFLQFLMRSIGLGRRRIMLLGKGSLAESMETTFIERHDPAIHFTKRIDPGSQTELKKAFQKYHVDELIIADHALDDNQTLEYLMTANEAGVMCHLVPNLFEVQSGNVLYGTIAGLPIMTFRQTPLEGWGRIVKRLIDFVVASIGLVLLSPLFFIISLIIKLTDPGPVIYAHTRISRGGKKIQVYKFRSMKQQYCVGGRYGNSSEIEIFKAMGREDLIKEFEADQKVKDDPRVSSIGRFLRKTSLDELPQFINVLKGDLSLVGPRPIVEDELPRYGKWGSYLLSIKPGVTGLWQVSGRSDITYDERVKLDTQYVQNWSLWQDFIIIIKTFLLAIVGNNGY